MLPTVLIRFGFQAAQVLSNIPILGLSILIGMLLTLAWGLETFWWLPKPVRWRTGIKIGITYLVWSAVDWTMLTALPILGLSFGGIAFPFTALAFLRATLYIVAAFAIKWVSRYRKGWRIPGIDQRQIVFLGMANLALTALSLYSLYYEPFALRTSHVHFSGPDFLPERALRVLQISDIHVERLTKREQQVLAQVEDLQPDLIVLTGDYLNLDYLDDPETLDHARQFLSQLEAPYGIYAVNGSVDKPTRMERLFHDLPISVLDDQVVVVQLPGGDLEIVGVSNFGLSRDRKAFNSVQFTQDRFRMLLYHTPDLIEEAAQAGFNLYLAGHTHGGQIRLPLYGAVITFSIHGKRFEGGLYQVQDTVLYVSRGLGMEGYGMPRARFLCPPELVLVEIGTDKP